MSNNINAEEYKLSGNKYIGSGDYENALIMYTKAINLDENNHIYFLNRALTHLKLNKFKECINDCNKCLILDPMNLKAIYRRGMAYKFISRLDLAAIDFSTVFRLDSSCEDAKRELLDLKKQNFKIDSQFNHKAKIIYK